jgi:Domain of unknown function (DUF4153)
MSVSEAPSAQVWTGVARCALGLIQGLALYGLSESRGDIAPEWLAALYLVALFVPLIVIGGLDALRPITLAAWTAAATVLLAGLGWYDVSRLVDSEHQSFSPSVFLAAAALVFVTHHLIAGGDEARKWIAPYARYFDLGWRHGAQLALAGMFTGAFWLVLMLGAALFDLIAVHALRDLIQKAWFSLPATTTMFAAAIHVTASQSSLVRGFRALGLMLLSWLAPVMTALAGAFLLMLPFTGLQPLWDTRAATAIMLGACVALVVLINATYQDGAEAQKPGWLRQWAVRIASVLLTPLALLAAYALYLRIDQYGLTPDRIYAMAVLAIGASYAASYMAGAFSKHWMRPLEAGNIAAALVTIAVCVAIFSPLADPARLSVDDQMRRFAAGKVSAAQLDVAFLRFEAGRYGRAALERLRDGGDAALAKRATEALAAQYRYEPAQQLAPLQAADITMHPQGATLPASFLAASNLGGAVEDCRRVEHQCDAYLLDMNNDGREEIVLAANYQASVYNLGDDGAWLWLAQVLGVADLGHGDVRAAPAQLNDLVVGGRRYPLTPVEPARVREGD